MAKSFETPPPPTVASLFLMCFKILGAGGVPEVPCQPPIQLQECNTGSEEHPELQPDGS